MGKRICGKEVFRKKLLIASRMLADPVVTTLGPEGLPILLERDTEPPLSTKDGVTVAEYINVKDTVYNTVINAMKEAAIKTNNEAGDGTTTAILLAKSLIHEGMKFIDAGVITPQKLVYEIRNISTYIVKHLHKIAVNVQNKERQLDVATIASNGDIKIAAKIVDAIENKKRSLGTLKEQVAKHLPELESMYEKTGARPVVKYYEAESGVKTILQDVIATTENSENKTYYIYSSADIKSYLYKAYPKFSEDRIAAKVKVKAIAIGQGGELVGLDERKWLTKKEGSPSYIFIYPGKVAMISLDALDRPVGVIIENDGLYETQKMIFESLWQTL